MSDEPWAYVAAEDMSAGVGIGFKCWKGDRGKSMMMVLTAVPFDQSAEYKDKVEVIFRIDKGERETLGLKPINMNGRVSFIADESLGVPVNRIMKDVMKGKTQVAIGLASQVISFPFKGSTKAFKKLETTCGL